MCRDPKNPELCKKILEDLSKVLNKLRNERLGADSDLDRLNLTGRRIFSIRRNRKAMMDEGIVNEENEGQKSTDNQSIEELGAQVSQLLTQLLITNQEGNQDRDLMLERSLQLGKLATKLLETSLDRVEIDSESIKVKELNLIIYTLLLQVL